MLAFFSNMVRKIEEQGSSRVTLVLVLVAVAIILLALSKAPLGVKAFALGYVLLP